MAKTPPPEHYFSMTRHKPGVLYNIRRPGMRYCETCKSHQPKGKTKAIKGWKCQNCKTKETS